MAITVRVPATTANLGPGFDCLGLALDLWNTAAFRETKRGFSIRVRGEGAGDLPQSRHNLLARAARRLYQAAGAAFPHGLEIDCENGVPLGSGLGSSSAAILCGMLGANALLGGPFSDRQVLELAAEMEGHPDNVAPALAGGLVICTRVEAGRLDNGYTLLTRSIPVPALRVVVTVPAFVFPTRLARAALPHRVPLADAVYNLGRSALVVEALRQGDLVLLGQAMEDRLHQPYRLKLIPGAEQALEAARRVGAAAAALSGAGPGLVAFPYPDTEKAVAAAMQLAFREAGLASRSFDLMAVPHGSIVLP